MSELNDESLYVGWDVYLYANHYELFPSEISLCRERQMDYQDDIDVDIDKQKAIEIIKFLQKHYKLEQGVEKGE